MKCTAEKLVTTIAEHDLCTGCGVCAGICPVKALTVSRGQVKLTGHAGFCKSCNICLNCCPAYGYPIRSGIGEIQGIYEAHSNNEEIRKSAASGGAVTQILLDLLEMNEADKVIVVQNDSDIEDNLVKAVLINDPAQIILSAGTKYMQASLEYILRELQSSRCRVAVVGTPCQIRAIRKAEEKLPILKQNIVVHIGFFCGYTYRSTCIDALSALCGVQKNNISRIIGWRENGIPGNFEIETRDNKRYSIPFIAEHSVDVSFFARERCRLCKDCYCEYADIVAGDIGRGWKDKSTLLISRTDAGSNIILKAVHEGNLSLNIIEPTQYKATNIRFMEKEKRSKTDLYSKWREHIPAWPKDLKQEPLFIFEIIAYRMAQRKEAWAQKNMNRLLNDPSLLRKVGYYCYSGVYLKPWFKFPIIFEAALRRLFGKWTRKKL